MHPIKGVKTVNTRVGGRCLRGVKKFRGGGRSIKCETRGLVMSLVIHY